MNFLEKKTILSLSAILSLRMIGLFMALPLFSLYMMQEKNASPELAGLAMGIYGLTQGIFQIPLGASSDYFGRKKIISLGLLLFIAGSCLIALAPSITLVIIGRALQGTGAIGSTVIALLSDLTNENQRSKAMAFIGMTIGISFSIALIAGPALIPWIKFSGIFWLSALLGLIALVILHTVTPNPTKQDSAKTKLSFKIIPALFNKTLNNLYISIFILHFIFTASFMAFPISIKNELHIAGNQQWIIYLPTLIIGFIISIALIVIAEKKQKMTKIFSLAIGLICLAEILLSIAKPQLAFYLIAILLFFAGFSTLEALLPSLVSRRAPTSNKGSALGIYSSAQFSGIFIGGLTGGWMIQHYGITTTYLVNIILSVLWLLIAARIPNSKNLSATSS